MSFKESTSKELTEYYHSHGFEATVDLGTSILHSKKYRTDADFRTQVRGELCECIALFSILEFMKTHPALTKNWILEQGLILKDVSKPSSNYLTELDITLFTPQVIFALECKSYGGDKKIKDICTIVRKNSEVDVFKQHKGHVETLIKNIDSAYKGTNKSARYQLMLFNFSRGKVEETRGFTNQLLMPCVDHSTIGKWLTYWSEKPSVWDMNVLKKMVSIISKNKSNLTEQHLQYVRGLQH